MTVICLLIEVLGFLSYIYCTSEDSFQQNPSLAIAYQTDGDSGSMSHKNSLYHQVLHEVISGPLKDKSVALMMPQHEDSLSDDVVQSLMEPTFILRIPLEQPQETHNLTLLEISYGDDDAISSLMEPSTVLLIIIPQDDLWWPLWYPDASWSPGAAVLLSNGSFCRKRYLFQSPLLQRIPSVALICTDARRRKDPLASSAYSVWTWLPFVSGNPLLSLGMWDPEAFSDWNHLLIDRFKNMDLKHISILASDQDPPLLSRREDGSPRGLNFHIVDSLSHWLKFHYEIQFRADVKWASISDSVKAGLNDLMINFGALTPERNRDFQLSVPYNYEGFGLILKVPPPLPKWQNIIYPFTMPVWISTFVFLLLTAITYHALYHEHEKSFVYNTMTISQSLLSSPLEKVPSQWRIRAFLLPWWLSSWVLELSYICNLIAVLTIPVFSSKIQTTQELADSNFRLCMVDYGEFVPQALAVSTHPVLATLGRKLDMVPLMETWTELGQENCLKYIMDGSHAHLDSYSYIRILYSRLGHNSKVYTVKEQLYPTYLAFLIQKHSPWKHKFDMGIQWLTEAGLLQKWLKNTLDELIESSRQDISRSEQKPLTLGHLEGPFFVLGFGLFIASIAMGGEIIVRPSKNEEITT